MKPQSLIAALMLGTAPAIAADTFVIDDTHTYPSFEVNHLGWSVTRGRFDKVTGSAVLDFPAKTGAVDIVIDTNSLNTGLAKRDAHLRAEDFFNVAQYPTIRFRSDKLQFEGERIVAADGELTLLGVTRPVRLVFNLFRCGKHPIPMYQGRYYCGGDASTVIRRSDFGMTAYPGAIGEDVKLAIQVEAVRTER